MNEELKKAIHENRFYTQQEKDLYLAKVDTLSEEQAQTLLGHLQSHSHYVDKLPPTNGQDTDAILNILGMLHTPEEISQFEQMTGGFEDQITDEEWNKFMDGADQSQEKMFRLFLTLGPDGIEHTIQKLFESYSNGNSDMDFNQFTEMTAALSGMKQLITKALREYTEEMETIFLQEAERQIIEQKSSLEQAENLVNDLLQ